MGWQRWALIVLMLMGFTLAWLLLKPDILGFIYDDGVYLLAAKTLAHGQGYWMNAKMPALPIVKYPPLFPLLLAPLWWLFPHFPDNIMVFKLVPLLCLLLVLLIVYRQGLRQQTNTPWLALIPVALLALDGSVAYVSSALFSETLYMVLSLAFLFWLQRKDTLDSATFPSPFKVALFSVLPFYTRSIGSTLIVAVFLWLWHRRGLKLAGRYLAWSSLLMAPWLIWSTLHAPPVLYWKDILLVDYNHGYLLDLWINYHQLGGFWPWLWSGLQALDLAIVNRLFRILPHLALSASTLSVTENLLGCGLGLGVGVWAWRYRRPSRWSLAGLYVGLYLIALVFWSTDKDQYWRLLIPLFPLGWLCLIQGFQTHPKLKVILTGFMLQFLTGAILTSKELITHHFSEQVALNAHTLWQEYQDTFRFIITLPKDRVLLSPYHSVYFLYTGHRGWCLNTYLINPNFGQDDQSKADFLEFYSQLLKKNHVQYLILEPAVGFTNLSGPAAMPLLAALVMKHPEHFNLVYQSRSNAIKVYKIHL